MNKAEKQENDRKTGWIAAHFYLDRRLWNDVIPPPEDGTEITGEQAAQRFLSQTAAPEMRQSFASGWDAYRENPEKNFSYPSAPGPK